MAGFLVILFPFVLLGFLLFMGRVEEPLSRVTSKPVLHLSDEASAALDEEGGEPVRTSSARRRIAERLRIGQRRSNVKERA